MQLQACAILEQATLLGYQLIQQLRLLYGLVLTRGGVLKDVLGLEDMFWSPWPWSLKSLASKPEVLKNCPVLGSRTALFFEPLKFCWKMPETLRKICKYLFCFLQLQHWHSQTKAGLPPNWNFIDDKNATKKCIVQFQFLFSIFCLHQ